MEAMSNIELLFPLLIASGAVLLARLTEWLLKDWD
jgi:hypothetical protein